MLGVAAIAQWICLRLPSCCPGFESQAHHLHFYNLQYLCYICHVERTKINKKRPGLVHFLKKSVFEIYEITIGQQQQHNSSSKTKRNRKRSKESSKLFVCDFQSFGGGKSLPISDPKTGLRNWRKTFCQEKHFQNDRQARKPHVLAWVAYWVAG